MSISNVSGGLQPLSLPSKSNDDNSKRQQDNKAGADANTDSNKKSKNHEGNHATDVGVNGHLMTAEEREAAAKKARQDAVDLSKLNLRIARVRDHSKMMDAETANTMKAQLIASFANLKQDDASAIFKAKRVVNVPIAQELADKTIRGKAMENTPSIFETPIKEEKPPTKSNANLVEQAQNL